MIYQGHPVGHTGDGIALFQMCSNSDRLPWVCQGCMHLLAKGDWTLWWGPVQLEVETEWFYAHVRCLENPYEEFILQILFGKSCDVWSLDRSRIMHRADKMDDLKNGALKDGPLC